MLPGFFVVLNRKCNELLSSKELRRNTENIQFEDTRMYKGKAVARKLCELCGIDDFTDKASKDGTSVDL